MTDAEMEAKLSDIERLAVELNGLPLSFGSLKRGRLLAKELVACSLSLTREVLRRVKQPEGVT